MMDPHEFAKVPAQLDLIHDEGIDTAFVEDSFLEDHFPVGFSPSINDKITFFIRGTEHWIDFTQSFMHITGEIIGTSDTHVSGSTGPKTAGKTDTDFFLEQNFWHSIFSSVDVEANDTSISVNNTNYPYAAYFQNLLNLSSDQQKTIGALCYWGSSKEEIKTDFMNQDTVINGIIQIKTPLFLKTKNLLPFVNVSVNLNRVSKASFFFRWGTSTSGYSFKINSIVFKVRKVKVKDAWNEFYETYMQAGNLVRYNFKDFRVFTRTYSGFGSDIIEDNLFHGGKPESVILGFVENEAFSGHKTKNPFKFEHFTNAISEIGLFVNGQPFPVPMIKTNFATKDTFEAYHLLMASLTALQSPDPPIISKKAFDAGTCTIFGFNLSPDQYSGADPKALYNQPANVRLHVKFNNANATKNITLIVYYEMHSVMAINKTRQVIFQSR